MEKNYQIKIFLLGKICEHKDFYLKITLGEEYEQCRKIYNKITLLLLLLDR